MTTEVLVIVVVVTVVLMIVGYFSSIGLRRDSRQCNKSRKKYCQNGTLKVESDEAEVKKWWT